MCVLLSGSKSPSQMASAQSSQLKDEVQDFWNAEPCGSRYLEAAEDFEAFEAHLRSRYALEPHIPQFAKFSSARDLRVLEIGAGIGADYLEWLRAGADATGIDLSAISIERAKRRCVLAGYEPDLRVADAERLPFAADTFDVVYSYGVMHHTPQPAQCLDEAWRVLKPGGEARIMLYHHPSLTGMMLWLRYGAWRGKSMRRTVFDHLQSPETKTYTKAEVRALMQVYVSDSPIAHSKTVNTEPFLRARMPELDSIRGIAVLLVLFYHGFGFAYGLSGLRGIGRLFVAATLGGWVGVNLFFVLSGFLITGILLDTKARADYYKRFYFRRALRILPLYYAVLCLLVVLTRAGLINRHVSWAFLGLSSIYMANVTELFGIPMQYGVLWSLGVEEHFYLFWPIAVRLLSRRGIAIAGTIICIMCTSLRSLSYVLGGQAGAGYTWLVADGLAMGAVLASLIRGPLGTRAGIRNVMWAAFASSVFLFAVGTPFGILSARHFLGMALRPIAINLFFVGIISMALRLGTCPWKTILNLAPLRFVGDISYCVYLIHMLVFELVDHVLARLNPSLPPGREHIAVMALRFFAAASFTIGLAALSRRYFENPFLRLKARFDNGVDVSTSRSSKLIGQTPSPAEDLQTALEIAR